MWEVSAALEVVLRHAKPLPAEMTSLAPTALGQVLAEDVASDLDSPPFDKSMMDGYAVRAADCQSNGVELTLVEEIQAGAMPTKAVGAGECSRIFTGAPIPTGADAVVMKEKSEIVSSTRIRILEDPVIAGRNILSRGREMRIGDTVMSSGAILTPTAYGLLATVGKTAVRCFPRPRVAVVSTGNEIVEPVCKPGPGQIRNSNGPMLVALAARAGAVAHYLGIALDHEAELRNRLDEGLRTANVLLVTGGVSVGSFDLVPGVLESLGVTVHFHKIRMKPGKPLLFGTKGETLVFGLPGNPVSGFVGFELFVKPALRAMARNRNPTTLIHSLPLIEPLATSNDRPTYHPARREGNAVRPLPWFGSADLRGLLAANALIVLPPGEVRYSAGQVVEVMEI